jgi:HlyD family secretion protein
MVPVVSNNVVSYTVVINVENHDGSLLPGMTCLVDFIVEQAENVLMVSNAALRYQPTSLDAERIAEMVFNASLASMSDEQRQAATEAREQQKKATQDAAQGAAQGQNTNNGITGLMMGNSASGRRMMDRMMRPSGGQERNAPPAVVIRNLWYVNGDGRLEVMQVEAGITNGSLTEIRPLEDIEGRQVILREKI